MAKKDYNQETIKDELRKITLSKRIEEFHAIGEWIHQDIQDAQQLAKSLEDQLKKNGKEN